MVRRTLLIVVLVAATLVAPLPGWGTSAAQADDRAGDADSPSMVLPSNARPGDRVQVYSKGWPAGAQVQAVLCGDDAIGGSSTCHLPGAATDRADQNGVVVLELVVGRPPRPCPCVVRVSSFSTDAPAQNLPINVIGHRTGTPPVPSRPVADLQLDDVAIRLSGSTLGRLLGLGGPAQVVVTVRNTGNADAPVPELRYGFGSGGPGLTGTTRPDVLVPALQSRDVVIDVDVPAGTIGDLQARVAWANDAGATVDDTRTTYPWAWLALLVVALAAAAGRIWWRVRGKARSDERRRRRERLADYPLPDVVFVEDVGGFLVNPATQRGRRLLNEVAGRLSTEDLIRLAAGGAVTTLDLPEAFDGVAPHGGQHTRLDDMMNDISHT